MADVKSENDSDDDEKQPDEEVLHEAVFQGVVQLDQGKSHIHMPGELPPDDDIDRFGCQIALALRVDLPLIQPQDNVFLLAGRQAFGPVKLQPMGVERERAELLVFVENADVNNLGIKQ